jgi:putative ABC transport system substrate-binding protein
MWGPFREQLSALGYTEGRNVTIESRSPEGTQDSFSEAARELVELPTDVLAVYGTSATQATQRATTRIPIVMIGIGDPVGASHVSPGVCRSCVVILGAWRGLNKRPKSVLAASDKKTDYLI